MFKLPPDSLMEAPSNWFLCPLTGPSSFGGCFCLFVVVSFETGSLYVIQAVFELTTLLLLPLKCWSHKQAAPHNVNISQYWL